MPVSDEIAAMQKILASPDIVDFVVRRTEYIDQLLGGDPRVIATQTLLGRYTICYTMEKDFRALAAYLGTSFISSASLVLGTLDRQSLESAHIVEVQQQPYLRLLGSGVLFGIVDTGIDYTLPVFRYEDGTSKIQFLFDQNTNDNPPNGFYLGTEYTNEQINAALKSEHPYEIVPERDESGHGTFLASIAAGRPVGDFIGAVPDAEIIAVKLRPARPFYRKYYCVPDSQLFAFESSATMVGVEYILKTARKLNRPAVICLGLGTNLGGHDGYALFEEYLGNVSGLPGVCLCTAAGNESRARHHTQGIVPAQGLTRNIDIKVGKNAGDVFISIWNGVSDRMGVSVRSPTGELVGRVPPKTGFKQETSLVLEKASVFVEYYFPLEAAGSQLTIVKLLRATEGIWTIILDGDIILDGTFHAWLPINGFVSPDVEFLSATPYYTLTVPSTMIGSITCGAYDSSNNTLYSDSSWSPNRIEENTLELVAPGVNVGGYFPSGYGAMSGTSVATAITAGACAQMLEWGIVKGNDPALNTYQIRAYLIRGCERSNTIKYPSKQWGYGTLNLMQTFQYMREM